MTASKVMLAGLLLNTTLDAHINKRVCPPSVSSSKLFSNEIKAGYTAQDAPSVRDFHLRK